MNHVIVVEGLDGSGKSTVASHLANATGTKMIVTPPAEIECLRRYAHDLSLPGRFYFYTLGNLIASKQMWEAQAKGSIIVDRFYASTIAGLLADNWAAASSIIGDLKAYRNLFRQPSVTLFLDCSYQVRLERLKARNKSTSYGDDLDFASHQKLSEAFLFVENSLGEEWVRISTDGKPISETLREIFIVLTRDSAGPVVIERSAQELVEV